MKQFYLLDDKTSIPYTMFYYDTDKQEIYWSGTWTITLKETFEIPKNIYTLEDTDITLDEYLKSTKEEGIHYYYLGDDINPDNISNITYPELFI